MLGASSKRFMHVAPFSACLRKLRKTSGYAVTWTNRHPQSAQFTSQSEGRTKDSTIAARASKARPSGEAGKLPRSQTRLCQGGSFRPSLSMAA